MLNTDCFKETSEQIVTHVTQVKISLLPDTDLLKEQIGKNAPVSQSMIIKNGEHIANHYTRVVAIMDLLEGHGFSFRIGKNAILCLSDEVEAKETKRLLLSAGFKDREFQIVLVYTRGWGML